VISRGTDIYLTTHNTRKRQTSMPPTGSEPAVPASGLPQTVALDHADTGIGSKQGRGRKYSPPAMQLMWCGVVWCGMVWCGVVWCGVVGGYFPIWKSRRGVKMIIPLHLAPRSSVYGVISLFPVDAVMEWRGTTSLEGCLTVHLPHEIM